MGNPLEREMPERIYLFVLGFFKLFGLGCLISVALIVVLRLPQLTGRLEFAVAFVTALFSIYLGLFFDGGIASYVYLLFTAVGLGIITGQDILTHGFTDPIRIAIVLFELVSVLWIAGVVWPKVVTTWRIYGFASGVLLFQIFVNDFSSDFLLLFSIQPQSFTSWGLAGAGALSMLAALIYQRNARLRRSLNNAIDGGTIMLAYYLMQRMTKSASAKFEIKRDKD